MGCKIVATLPVGPDSLYEFKWDAREGRRMITYIGRQSGFGLTEDLDLYNVAPVNTTISVPAGLPVEAVHEHAAEVLANWRQGK